MKKVIFIRTAPYNYLIEGCNLYESFDAVAKKKIDVSLRNDARIVFKKNFPRGTYKEVFCSPRLRSKQTARFLTKNPKQLSILSEVYYGMGDFITQGDFLGKDHIPNVMRARTAFVNALIENKLGESYKNVINRVKKVLKKASKSELNQIFISHGFFLKIIEAYIKDPSIEHAPSNLLKYFDGKGETFHFCEGFKVEFDGKKFTFKKYLRNIKVSDI